MIWSATLGGGDVVQATRYVLATASWTPAVTLSTPLADADAGGVDTDALGNAFAVWNRFDGVQEIAQAARYNGATGAWSVPRDLGAMGDDGEDVQVAVNAAGNAVFGWDFEDDTTDKVQFTEWLANPAAPAITSITPGDRTLTVAFTPPPVSEDAFAATHYEYLLEDVTHLGWIGRTPPFTGSPITVVSLTNGASYAVRVRAWNRAGAGAPSAPMSGTPGGAVLLAPADLRLASIAANTVTLAWTATSAGIAATGFVLEGGIAPGEVLASLPTGSAAATFTFTAPTGGLLRARACRRRRRAERPVERDPLFRQRAAASRSASEPGRRRRRAEPHPDVAHQHGGRPGRRDPARRLRQPVHVGGPGRIGRDVQLRGRPGRELHVLRSRP
jgi:hypothetical protein